MYILSADNMTWNQGRETIDLEFVPVVSFYFKSLEADFLEVNRYILATLAKRQPTSWKLTLSRQYETSTNR
jgi:hypothetical protein